MKKWFKRNTKQIFALAIVFVFAFAMCISISADDPSMSHIEAITFGGVSIVSNPSYIITEQLSLGDYFLNITNDSAVNSDGFFECTLYDFYVYDVTDGAIVVNFNNSNWFGNATVEVNYSESLDSTIISQTFNFSDSDDGIIVPYDLFELETFYIHSITVSADIVETEFASCTVFLASVSEFERPVSSSTSLLDSVLDVFSNVGTWIAESVQNLIPMFYDEGSLTFLGVLAVAGPAISVIFVILSLITNFLRFRG